jgi:photosystem II stability/assembly factor-like uncharacterized protein
LARGWRRATITGRHPYRILAAVTALAAVAVLALVVLPLWRGPAIGPAGTASGSASASPTASATADLTPPPLTPRGAAARADQFGIAPDGAMWVVRQQDSTVALYVSTDHGLTWSGRSLPAEASQIWCSVDFVDAGNGWACSAGYRTTDGGRTWQPVVGMPVPEGGTYLGMSFVDARTLFFAFDRGANLSTRFIGTQDGGATWHVADATERIVTDISDGIVASDASTLWTGAVQGISFPRPLLQVSRDGGATWSDAVLPGLGTTGGSSDGDRPLTPSLAALPTFLSQTDGFVAVDDYLNGLRIRYFRTEDAGRTWSEVSTLDGVSAGPPTFVDAGHWFQPVSTECEWFCMDLSETRDGGRTWAVVASQQSMEADVSAQLSFNVVPNAFWTVDGINGALIPGDWSDGSVPVAILTADGGKTWRLASFTGSLIEPSVSLTEAATPTLGPAKCESSPPETFYQAVAWLDSKVVLLADHFVGCDLHQELLAVDPAAGTVRSIVGLSDVVSQTSSDGSSIAVPTAAGLFVIDASGKRRDLKLSADALKDLTWYDSLRPLPGGGYLIGGGSKLYRIASDGSRLTTDALPAGYVAVAPTSDPNLFILTPTEDAGGPYALSVKAPYRAYLWDLRKGSPKLVASDVGSVEKAPDSLAYLETVAAGPDGGTSFSWLSLAADGTVTPIAHLSTWDNWVSRDGSLYLYVADQSTSAIQTVELRVTSTQKVLASYRGAVTMAVWRGNVVAVMGKTETGADELIVLDGASVTHVAMP